MLKTVESVTSGHSDKICDQIADAIVDEYLRRDRNSRVNISVLGSHGILMIGGEISSSVDFDISALAKNVYKEIGYVDDLEVFVNVEGQTEEMKRIKSGVLETVVINGYATNETRERLPRALVYANTLARRLDDLRKTNPTFSWMKPDGRVQISMLGDKVKIVTLLVSHHVSINDRDVRTALLERLVIPFIGEEGLQVFINPTGEFNTAGFRACSGVSGRKSCIDTYGGLIPHGNKHLSGKDPSRADRTGTYMARFAARYLVENGLATSALVNVVYTIGKAEPIHIHAIGMGEKSRGAKINLTEIIKKEFDFRPEAIVERFDLLRPIYRDTAVYGCFGRDESPWESHSATM